MRDSLIEQNSFRAFCSSQMSKLCHFTLHYLLDSETKRSQNIVYSNGLIHLTLNLQLLLPLRFFFLPFKRAHPSWICCWLSCREEHHQRAWTELLSGTLVRFPVAFKALHHVKGFSSIHTLEPSSCCYVKMTPLTAPQAMVRTAHSIDLLAARCETK